MLCIVGSCGTPNTFLCESDAECGEGQCELNGFCSFEDGSCESGRRYGEHAGQLSGNCVAGMPVAEDTTSETTEGSEGEGTTDDSDGEGTTLAVGDSGSDGDAPTSGGIGEDSSTSAAVSTTDSSGSSGESSGESSGTSTGGGAMEPHAYGECEMRDDCEFESLCMPVVMGATSQCLPLCMDSAECPEAPGEAGQGVCFKNFCVLPCMNPGDQDACPEDMVCSMFGVCVPSPD